MAHISSISTTGEVMSEVGRRLRAYRLQQNRSVEDVANAAGLGKNTVLRAEGGENPTLDTIVRILRVLGRIEALDAFLPEPLVSPMQLIQLHGHPRERARPRRAMPAPESSSEEPSEAPLKPRSRGRSAA